MPRLMFPGPRARKVLRDTLGNKPRAMLVILSIAVGVFASGAMASARVILSRDLQAQYATSRDVSATISASNLTEDFVESIRQMPGVESAQGRTVVLLRARLKTPTGERRSNLILHALPDFNDQQVSIVDRLSGPLEPPRRELLLERASFALFGLSAPGEFITLELSDGTTRQIQVAGAVHDINAPPPRFANFGSGYVTYDTLAWLGFSRTYNQVRVRVSEEQTNRAHIQAIADQIKKRIEDSGRVFFSTGIALNPGRHYADEQIQSMSLILAVIGGLSLVLSGFLVINTVTAVMQQHVRQIGIMKTIGGRARQLTVMYLSMVAALGALSLTVSIPLGSTGARALTEFIASLLNFDILTTSTPPDVLLLEVMIGLAVPTLAALVPIRAGVRLSVREALSYTGMADLTPHPEEASSPRHNPVGRSLARLPRPFLLSLRNTFRRKGRLLLTLSTLVLAGAIFISVLNVQQAMYDALDITFGYILSDVNVDFGRGYRVERIQEALKTIPGITAFEGWGFSAAQSMQPDGISGDQVVLVAPPGKSTLIKPELISGRWLLPDDDAAIVVGNHYTKVRPETKVGDTLTIRIQNKDHAFVVVGIYKMAGNTIPPILYTNYEYLADLLNQNGMIYSIRVSLADSSPVHQQEVAEQMKARFKQLGMPVGGIQTGGELIQQNRFVVDILIYMLLIMAILIAVVGGLGLMGTMSMNVLERTREIGVMRSIGAVDAAIMQLVVTEGMLIGLISWGLGALLAIPITNVLNVLVGVSILTVPLDYSFAVKGLILWLGVVILLSTIASLMPARNAVRLTVRDVLAYE